MPPVPPSLPPLPRISTNRGYASPPPRAVLGSIPSFAGHLRKSAPLCNRDIAPATNRLSSVRISGTAWSNFLTSLSQKQNGRYGESKKPFAFSKANRLQPVPDTVPKLRGFKYLEFKQVCYFPDVIMKRQRFFVLALAAALLVPLAGGWFATSARAQFSTDPQMPAGDPATILSRRLSTINMAPLPRLGRWPPWPDVPFTPPLST